MKKDSFHIIDCNIFGHNIKIRNCNGLETLDKVRTKITIFSLIIALIFIILVAVQADKKFVLDEIDFPIVAHETSATWVPIYYRGENNSSHIGLYHPPLYIYALASFIRIFGYSEISVRMFGALCVLLDALLIIGIFRLIFPVERYKYFEPIFMAIFLFHPYTIANATLPDIDSTILPVVMLLFIYILFREFLRFPLKAFDFQTFLPKMSRSIFVLGLVFALCLWTKLTTPLVLPIVSILFLLLLKVNWKVAFVISALITFIGILIFLSTFGIYCFLLHLPFNYTFNFLWQSFTKGTKSSDLQGQIIRIKQNLSYIPRFINWLTIPFVCSFFVTIISLVKMNAERGIKMILLLALIGFFLSLFYLGLISPFGGFFKYAFPGFILMTIPIAVFISGLVSFSQTSSIIGIFLGIIVIAGIQIKVFSDTSIRESNPSSLLLMLALSVFGSILIRFFVQSRKIIAYSLFVLLVGVSIGISREQAVAIYPTKYYYGQTGLNETIEYIRAETEDNEIIWSMKDVGYYVNNRYVENYSYLWDSNSLNLLIEQDQVEYYVMTKGIGEDQIDAYPEIKYLLETNTVLEKEFGNFLVYREN